MEKELLKKIIISQNSSYERKVIERDKFKHKSEFKNNLFIIIISGIRRCGKSTFLQEIRKKEDENKYFLNFDDNRLEEFNSNDFEKLYESFLELYGEENNFYFDEIQNINGWERFVRRLHDEKNKIYITGSNASMLSFELGTRLTGRNLQMNMYPFSFQEFLRFCEIQIYENDLYDNKKVAKIRKLFIEYLKDGGFPDYLKSKSIEYLKNLYDNILYRDIIARYNLPNEKVLKELVYYLISNISKEMSYNSIKKFLNLSNANTVKEYISYFENSFLLFEVTRFHHSLKIQSMSPKKIYCVDNGFANSISFKFSEDYGRLLENLVFVHLKRNSNDIYYHKNKFECDFLIKEGINIVKAIQVTKSLASEETRKREINGLMDALKSYDLKEGLILSDDEEFEEIIDGKKIIIKPIWKWLLS